MIYSKVVNGITYTVDGSYAYVGNATQLKSNGIAPGYSPTDLTFESKIDNIPVTTIQCSAFYGYAGITSITFPESIVKIENSAFDCCQISFVFNLPPNLEFIGCRAFAGGKFASVSIPATVTFIGSSPFGSNSLLTEITIDPANTHYVVINKTFLYNSMKTVLLQAPEMLYNYVFEPTLVEIGYAVLWNSYATELTFPMTFSHFSSHDAIAYGRVKKVKFLGNLHQSAEKAIKETLDEVYYYGTKPVISNIFQNEPGKIFVCKQYRSKYLASFDVIRSNESCPLSNIIKECSCDRNKKRINFVVLVFAVLIS